MAIFSELKHPCVHLFPAAVIKYSHKSDLGGGEAFVLGHSFKLQSLTDREVKAVGGGSKSHCGDGAMNGRLQCSAHRSP